MNICWNRAHPDQALLILSSEEARKRNPEYFTGETLPDLSHPIRFCRILYDRGVLSGTFVIPRKEQPIADRMSFAFVLENDSLCFISDEKAFHSYLQAFMDEYTLDICSAFQFLLRFMNYMIQEDVYFLEDYNEKLETIEENIFENKESGMERYIMMTRRDMNILGNYYLQLTAVGHTMQETIIPQDQPNENAMISLFLANSTQLENLASTIKDYTSQIWNLRQTQLSDRQNKVSTLLTIISTVFLPLTFLTGWYGMNFQDMPLIKYRYGYAVIIVVMLVIAAGEILYLRKRRWLGSDKAKKENVFHHDKSLDKKLHKAIREDHKQARKDEKADEAQAKAFHPKDDRPGE